MTYLGGKETMYPAVNGYIKFLLCYTGGTLMIYNVYRAISILMSAV